MGVISVAALACGFVLAYLLWLVRGVLFNLLGVVAFVVCLVRRVVCSVAGRCGQLSL